jgi:hypothetical protein
MALDFLLQQVKNAVYNDSANAYQPNNHPGNLISQIEGLFGQHAAQYGNTGIGNVLPASQDPLGDPADQPGGGFGNVLPASRDPLGDPADQPGGGQADLRRQFPNLRPASQDPLGDPADQER